MYLSNQSKNLDYKIADQAGRATTHQHQAYPSDHLILKNCVNPHHIQVFKIADNTHKLEWMCICYLVGLDERWMWEWR